VAQVTSEPGEVRLLLTWPNLPPLQFKGEIFHEPGLAVIEPRVSLDVGDTQYTIGGQVTLYEILYKFKYNSNLRINGMLQNFQLHRDDDQSLKLSGTAGYRKNKTSAPIEIMLTSDFTFPNSRVDGTVTVTLPFDPPWTTSTVTIEYEKVDANHKFQ